jgi:hypothetical protein
MREAELRSALERHLVAEGPEPARTIAEFWIPVSHERADLVVVGRWLYAFELKSAADNLLRLPRQVAAYGRVFDRCTAVVAERHLAKAVEQLPVWWGVMTLSPVETSFTVVRECTLNVNIDESILVRLLWKEEARAALLGLGERTSDSESRDSMWGRLLSALDRDQMRVVVRDTLARRDPAAARFGARILRSPAVT